MEVLLMRSIQELKMPADSIYWCSNSHKWWKTIILNLHYILLNKTNDFFKLQEVKVDLLLIASIYNWLKCDVTSIFFSSYEIEVSAAMETYSIMEYLVYLKPDGYYCILLK